MHIGLIGGIGVAATVVYYKRLAAAVGDLGGTLDLTIEHGDIQTLIRNFNDGAKLAQARVYAGMIDRLKAAGCECAAITSIGGHFCFDETRALSSLPLISGVAPLDDAFVARGVRRVGLLGTWFVMRSRIYGQLRKTEAVTLDDEIDEIGATYQDMAVTGVCTEAQREFFLDAGRRLVRDHGADAILLAGTDLNLAFDGQDLDYPVIDAVDVHVSLLADLATGRRGFENAA
jgi:aspartate racemase